MSANENARALISMMARSKSSDQRPDTLMQDRKPTARRKPLAKRGRTIHWGQTLQVALNHSAGPSPPRCESRPNSNALAKGSFSSVSVTELCLLGAGLDGATRGLGCCFPD